MTLTAPGFDPYFQEIYGPRWPDLKAGLLGPENQVSFRPLQASQIGEEHEQYPWLPGFIKTPASGLDDSYYTLDPASVLAAQALEVQPGDQVLDMCAAPGGKTLILAQALRGLGHLYSNEPSFSRRERLKRVIQKYIPLENRSSVSILGKDGLRFGMMQPEAYDRILVDAPCSGERHLLETPSELSTWTPKRSENLAKRQYGLLTSALLALKPGGTLVYSTCSISPLENDGVISRLLKKKGETFTLDLPLSGGSPLAEKTEFGWVHLPDRAGFGPLYFSRLKKR